MLKALPRTFIIFKMYRGRLILSQVLLLISALCMIGVATLNQTLINNGIIAGDVEAIVRNGLWMAGLAVLAGVTMAGTAALGFVDHHGRRCFPAVERRGGMDVCQTGHVWPI